MKNYRGTQKINVLPVWTFVQSNKHNRQQKIMQCDQLYSVWHHHRPITAIASETSRHAVFMPEPSDRNTLHPLDTADVAMIIASFEIKFPVLLYCASYKSCHPAGIHCKGGFSHLGPPWIQICWGHKSYKLYSTYNLKRLKCTKSCTQVGDSGYKWKQSKSNNCHDIDTNKHKTTTWIISDCPQREMLIPEGGFPLRETVRPQLGLQCEVTLTSSSLFVLFSQQTYPLMPINPAFCTHALLKRKLGHGWHRPCSVYTLGCRAGRFSRAHSEKKRF